MNITQIMLAKNFGGAERLFVDFSIALAESGENVQAICQKDSAAARLLEDYELLTSRSKKHRILTCTITRKIPMSLGVFLKTWNCGMTFTVKR